MAMMYAERAASRQITSATAVIGVHAALIFALVTGLAEREPIVPPPYTEVVPVPQEPTVDPAPPIPPRVDTAPTDPPDIPVPWVKFDDPRADDVVVGEYVDRILYDPPVTGPAQFLPLSLRSDPRHPLAPPEYPASAIRRNQEGIVQLLIYVLPNGNVADVKIGRSSGYPLLDEAAVRKARAAWRFLPATSGSGQAIAAWGTYDVRFELKLN